MLDDIPEFNRIHRTIELPALPQFYPARKFFNKLSSYGIELNRPEGVTSVGQTMIASADGVTIDYPYEVGLLFLKVEPPVQATSLRLRSAFSHSNELRVLAEAPADRLAITLGQLWLLLRVSASQEPLSGFLSTDSRSTQTVFLQMSSVLRPFDLCRTGRRWSLCPRSIGERLDASYCITP